MTLKKLNTDKILGLSAMLISICTLIVFLYQTNLIKEQQYMSVYPYLTLGNNGSFTADYEYSLTNNGIGPALISSVKVSAKNGKIYTDISPYVQEIILNEHDSLFGFYHSNLFKGMIIPAGGKIDIIQTIDKRLETSNRLYDILNDTALIIQIEYESIYGELWEVSNKSKVPVKK